MDFSTDSLRLAAALGFCQNLTAKKTTNPALTNILMIAKDNSVQLTGGDIGLAGKVSLPAKVTSEGKALINAKLLFEVIRELPETDVRFKGSANNRIIIETKDANFKLVGYNPDEYPSFGGLSLEPKSQINAKLLGEMISKSVYASSTDDTRVNLFGVCFEGQKGASKGSSQVRLVATDGFRLAFVDREMKGISLDTRPIVPRRALTEVAKLLSDSIEEEVNFGFSEGYFVVASRTHKVAAQLADTEFPEYAQVIPTKKGHKASIKGEVFISAIRRMMLLVSDKEKSVRFQFKNQAIEISSSSSELGEAREVLECDYDGPEVIISLNAQYLIEAAQAISGQDGLLMIEVRSAQEAVTVTNPNDESALSLIMPMRL